MITQPHYAFDWGGVLEDRAAMWEIAELLSDASAKVSIISWCGEKDGPKSEAGKKRIADSLIPWVNVIGFGNAPEVKLPINPDGKAEHQIGLAKARTMKEIGAQAIFDDNPHVCRAVRDAGLQAFLVIR